MAAESVPFTQSLELALTGAGAPAHAVYDRALGDAARAAAQLKADYEAGALELLRVPERTDDLAAADEAAAALKNNTTDIAVLGIGGASLGAKALADLRPWGRADMPRVRVFENCDGASFGAALASFDLKTARFVAVSKSGGTPETLMQTLAAADAIERAGGGKYLRHHFVVVTEAKPSPLRKFAETIGCPILDHPLGVGGRYSVLTVAGLLPALLMGLDVRALRAGARAALAPILAGKPSFAEEGAALHFALSDAGRLRETVLWSYTDRLKTFGPWWRQLWAESLGKHGKGTTPVAALGPVDQHSQLQLFLDGPGGTLFTLVTTDTDGTGPRIGAQTAEGIGAAYLGGRTIGDLVAAEARATTETLAKRGRPVRRIHVPRIDERGFGALLMHFMIETILMGRLMGVDPFSQPAVEEGKVLARRYLEAGR